MGTYLGGLPPLPLPMMSDPGQLALASPGKGAEFTLLTPTHQDWVHPFSSWMSDEGPRLFLLKSVFSKRTWVVRIRLTLNHNTAALLLVPYALPAQLVIQPGADFAAPAAGVTFARWEN